MKKIRVLVADDHSIVREGLKHLLRLAPDMEVIGEAETGAAAVRQARELRPDVVLMDIAMPERNGIEAAREIQRDRRPLRVLVLSTYQQDDEVRLAIEAGAAGYVAKQSAGRELLMAVREVYKGRSFFSPAIARRMLRQTQRAFRSAHGDPAKSQKLTRREWQVLRLIAEGNGNKEAAAALGISPKTVEKHRQSLMDKIDLHDTASLTRYAVAKGVVPCRLAEAEDQSARIGPLTVPMIRM